MGVVLAFVLAFVVFRAVNRDNSGVVTTPVDYHPIVKSVRSDNRLEGWAPATLPAGWHATAARYSPGTNPDWHLSISDGNRYMVVEEGVDSREAVMGQAMQGSGTPAGNVTIQGVTWTAYTYSYGGYALARTMPSKTPRYPEWLVVGGSTSPEQVRAFAGSLSN